MSEHAAKPRPNYSRRRKVVGGALAGTLFATGAVAGKVIDDKVDDFRANRAQPACEVIIEPGDNVSDIMSELRAAGDGGDGVKVLTPEGRERRTLYAGEQGVPTVDAVQPGDELIASHVDPNVCQQVGGIVLQDAAPRD